MGEHDATAPGAAQIPRQRRTSPGARGRFRFRPRFRALAALVLVVGVGALAAGLLGGLRGDTRTYALVCGGIGCGLVLLYVLSPVWRIAVLVDDEALEVQSSGDRRFRLPWAEVVRVVASPATSTVWVYGGNAERSLLVPGDGASAPYDIERKPELYRAILARVPPAVVEEVDFIERAARPP